MSDANDLQSGYLDHRIHLAQASAADELLSRVKIGKPAPAAPATLPDLPDPEAKGGTVGRIIKDVGVGLVETPRAIVKGVRDAYANTFAIGDDLAHWLEEKSAGTALEFMNAAPGDGFKIRTPEELKTNSFSEMIPDINAPKTVTASLVKGVTQFLTGFKGAGKLLDAAGIPKVAGGLGYSRAALQGFSANFTAFDPHQQRLSNLVERFPALQNPVTEFLASDPDDGAAEGRFKNALEGLGLGVATDGFFKGIKLLHSVSIARKTIDEAAAAVETVPRVPENAFRILGDEKALPGAPLVGVKEAAATVDDAVASSASKATPSVEPKVPEGMTRLYRGESDVSEGAKWFTSIKDTADFYASKVHKGKDLSYIDLPSEAAERFRNGVDSFYLPPELAKNRKVLTPGPERISSAAPKEKPEVFINFARIDTPDDVKRAMQEMADLNADSINAAKRGKQSFSQIKLNAEQKDAWKAISERRLGEPMNAETAVAARQLWASSGDRLLKLSQMAAENPSESNLFAFRKMLTTHHAIQQEVIAARTETARALSSWRIPVGGSAERLRDITSILDTHGGAEVSRELAQRISALGQAGMQRELTEIVTRTAYAKTRDAILEGWINGLLSNPTTHIVNTMSNSTVMGLRMGERAVAGKIASLLGDEGSVAAGESAAQWFGMTQGFKDAFRYAWKSAKTGESGFGMGKLETAREGSISSEAFNLSSAGFVGRSADLLGSIVRTPGRALTAEDEFFKTLGYRMELNAQALRMATQEVSKGQLAADALKSRIGELVQNAPENLRMAAVDAATYQTFTNTPGKLAQHLGQLTRDYPALKVILPFIRTPANILRFTFERTPLAPLMSQFRAGVSAGGARRDLALAQVAVGTTAMLSAADLAMNEQLSGAGPTDRSTRSALMRQGWQQYSVKVGDRWYAYNRLDPVGSLLGMAADTTETLRNGQAESLDDPDTEKLAVATAVSFAGNLVNKTYLSGLASVFEAMADPQRYGEATIQRMVGSVVPAGAANVARQMDPTAREVHSMIDAIKARTPGLSDSLPPRLNLWGEPIKWESGFGKVYDAFSPIYTRTGSNDPIDAEIVRIGASVNMPNRKTSFNGATVDLGRYPQAYARYVQLAGNELVHPAWGLGAKDLLNAVVSGNHPLSQVYQLRSDGPDGGKDVFIRDTLRQYQELARRQVLEEFPEVADEAGVRREHKRALRMPTLQ